MSRLSCSWVIAFVLAGALLLAACSQAARAPLKTGLPALQSTAAATRVREATAVPQAATLAPAFALANCFGDQTTPTTAVPPADSLLLFSSTRDCGYAAQLYAMRADGNQMIRLTTDRLLMHSTPTWSADRRWIAFTATGTGATPTEAEANFQRQGFDIFVLDSTTGATRQITHGGGANSDPAWSPDGRKIAFVRDHQIYVMQVDGSGLQKLSRLGGADTSPAWSPDGQQLAFSHHDDHAHALIYVMRLDGSARQPITAIAKPPATSDAEPSPDPIRRPPVPDFEELPNGIKPDHLTQDDHPSWSPDGRLIVFDSARDSNFRDIYVVAADGTGLRRLTTASGANNTRPKWSPDGRSVVYTSRRAGALHTALYLIHPDGTGDRRLTDLTSDSFDAVWAP